VYRLVINLHIVVSIVFLLLAATVLSRSIYGWIKTKTYSLTDNYLSIGLIVFLYFQLFSGILLYFFLRPQISDANLSLAEVNERSTLQFWAIEHLSLMLFAIMLSQLGRLFIMRTQNDRVKYKNTSFYYGVSFVLVLISIGIALVKQY
jgi:hypothetical protein